MTTKFSRRLDFSDVVLYAVTPDTYDTALLLSKTRRLLEGGVDAVQLRCRTLGDKNLVSFGKEMKNLCGEFGALFLVNNRPDIALAVHADGVHVGQEDLDVSFVRDLIGHRKIIGVSTHCVPEALAAQRKGADYVSCGPIWATPTKPDCKEVGLGLIGLYQAVLRVPFVAIGGIGEENIDHVVGAGANTVAVVRAFYEAADPATIAGKFRDKLKIKRLKAVV